MGIRDHKPGDEMMSPEKIIEMLKKKARTAVEERNTFLALYLAKLVTEIENGD